MCVLLVFVFFSFLYKCHVHVHVHGTSWTVTMWPIEWSALHFSFLFHFWAKSTTKLLMDIKLWLWQFTTKKERTESALSPVVCYFVFIVRCMLWILPFWPELTHLPWYYIESLAIYWILFDSFSTVNWSVFVLNVFCCHSLGCI